MRLGSAAALGEVTQEVAESSITHALEAGINHIDTAASDGEAELRLGPLMPAIRDRVFLATKTGDRDAEGAWASINRSLERLQTDHLDLIQLHGVHDVTILDAVTRPGGALESLVRAREEGLVRGIGITGHLHSAPATHAEALRRFDFDTVLTPLNHRLWREPGYAADDTALVERVRAADVGLMTIKMIAKRNWPGGVRRHATWYEPFEDQNHINAAITWLLNVHPEVTGLATAGEVALLDRVIEAEGAGAEITVAQASATLDALAPDEYKTVYDADMPW